ncbi:GNAT family N-acetyltransferase [Acidocella sp.]|uniref:GNAT family N-acetyltransferase n=1 Tax=Acidocella sp. TaxID=50710 RepID=UPI0026101613|nr:GNAT family N-acetyltransferase [Acidocella sp.]
MSGGLLHQAGPAHAAALAAMHAALFPAEPWDAAAFLALLGQPGTLGLVHEKGGFLLARQILDEAEILTLGAVTPRQGIGAALLGEALHRLGAAGVKRIFLEVAATNAAARALYACFGFTRAGERRHYYADGGDALILRRELDPSRSSEDQ